MKLTMHTRIHFLLLIALGFLAACVSNTANTVRIPDDLGQQGLLLVKLSSDHLAMLNKVQPQVNDKLYKDGYQDSGYVELVLAPGEYTFNSLMSSVQGGSNGRGEATAASASSVKYPIDKKFRIEAGKVSNLGILFFLTHAEENKKYTMVQIDNTEEARRHLQTAYPKLYASLRDKTPWLVPGVYLQAPELSALRKEIALRASTHMSAEDLAETEFLTATIGTLALIQKKPRGAAQGTPGKIDMIETHTLEDVDSQHCAAARGRLVCVLGGRLITVNGAERRAQPLPSPMAMVDRAHVFGTRGIVLTDRRLHIFSSLNNGVNWSRYDDAVLSEPLDTSTKVGFENGKKGFYIYSAGSDRTILYTPYAQLAYKKMELPAMVKNVPHLREFDGGVAIGPEFSLLGDATLYIGSFDSPQWAERRIPYTQCAKLKLEDRTSEKLSVVCLGQTYRSNDGGRTWEK